MSKKDDQIQVCIPTGVELYDAIMGEIEPELTTSQLLLLKKKYAKETAQEGKERHARYNRAFALYERCYQEYTADLDVKSAACQRTARKLADKHTKLEQSHAEQNLLDAIDSL